MKNILGLILAGGRVDELGVLTFFRPKSIVPFGGLYRIIDFPMSNLMHSGIDRVGIFSQYRPFHLMEHIANGASWDMVGRDRFAVILPPFKGREASDWYQGTADAVYQNLDFIHLHRPEFTLIISGDHVYNMDYRKVIAFHEEKKADLTIAFTKVPLEGAHRFGLATIDDEDERGGRVLKYFEKPKNPSSEWASLTIYIFKTALLVEALEANAREKSHEFGRDIIPRLVDYCRVYGYKHKGYWGYTRTPEEYWTTSMDLLGDSPKLDIQSWQVVTNLAHRSIQDRQLARIGKSGKIINSLFYSGCTIEGTVRNSILFPGVNVGENAVVENSIVFFDTHIESEAKVIKSIIDVESIIGRSAQVGIDPSGNITIVGRGTDIPDGLLLENGVNVYPDLERTAFTKSKYEAGEVIR